jgi:hypothetical protein
MTLDTSRDLTTTEAALDRHARLLLQGEHLEAAGMAATHPEDIQQLMGIASSLDELLQPLAMAPVMRGRLRQELLSRAYRRQEATFEAEAQARSGGYPRRLSALRLPRSNALRLIGAGTAVAAALGVAMVVRRRHGARPPGEAVAGLG